MSELSAIGDPGKNKRLQLGLFLRSRRESLNPGELGLPRMRQRRTPGLRREEVAQLADVGVTWYTWLEQGREINPSTKTLAAIAQALQCNEAETLHLFRLAGQHDPAPALVKSCCKTSQHNQRILDGLNPMPAIIESARFDITGWNAAICRLMNTDLAAIAPDDRNAIWLAFTCANWRHAIADWEQVKGMAVALFRARMAENLNDPHWEALLARLLANSDEFREIWLRSYEVRDVNNHVKRFYHRETGVITLHQNNWWSAPRNGDRLLVYTAEDDNSQTLLEKLMATGI